MTIDRIALRRLTAASYSPNASDRIKIIQAVPDLLDALEAAELRLSIATESNASDRRRIAELESQVADTRAQLARAERLLREYGIDPYAGLP